MLECQIVEFQQTRSQEHSKLDCRKPTDKSAGTQQSIPEITQETTQRTAADGAHSGDPLFWGDDEPKTPSGNGEKPHIEPRDVIVDTVVQAERRRKGEVDWLLPGTPCGDHDFLEAAKAFCGAIRRRPKSVGEKLMLSWLKQLETTAKEQSIASPHLMAVAIKAMRGEWGFREKAWRTPFSDGFVELVGTIADQIESGELTQQGAWSGAIA